MYKWTYALVAAGLSFGATISGASAQVGGVDAPRRALVTTLAFSGQFDVPNSSKEIYTVPSGRRFHLTDLIFTSYQNYFCDLYLSGRTYEIRLGPNTTLHLPLVSGPTYDAGEKVILVNTWRLPGHSDNCTPLYTVLGFLSKRVR
jgi:hypothetical protein